MEAIDPAELMHWLSRNYERVKMYANSIEYVAADFTVDVPLERAHGVTRLMRGVHTVKRLIETYEALK